jgi:hypothetical protein
MKETVYNNLIEKVRQKAEERYPAKQYELGSGHMGSPYYSLKEKQLAFMAGAEYLAEAAELMKKMLEWQEFLDHTDKEVFQEESKRFQEEREILYSRLKAFDQLAHEQHTFLEEAAQFLPLDEYARYKVLSEKYVAICGSEAGHISPHSNQSQ